MPNANLVAGMRWLLSSYPQDSCVDEAELRRRLRAISNEAGRWSNRNGKASLARVR